MSAQNSLTVRQAVETDLPFLEECVATEEYCRYIGGPLSVDRVRKIRQGDARLSKDIFIIENGEVPIGFAEYHSHDTINENIVPNIFICPPYRKTILTAKALFWVLKLAFEHYRVHKVALYVKAGNDVMNSILEKRITCEARLRKMAKVNNDIYEDMYVYGMLASEYQILYQRQKR